MNRIGPPRDSAAFMSARTRQPLPRGGRIRIASGLAIFDPTALAAGAFEHPHDAAASCVQHLANELGGNVASEASAIFGRVRSDDCIGTQMIHATLNRTSQGNAPKKNIRFEKSGRSPKQHWTIVPAMQNKDRSRPRLMSAMKRAAGSHPSR
jgi:hypothetical protein